jgi:hypothetical protein
MNAENMNVNSASSFFPNGRDWWAIKNFDRNFRDSKKSKIAKSKSALMVFHYHGNRAACGALQDENKGSHEV